MSTKILNNTPGIIWNGIDDQSTRKQNVGSVPKAQHCPLLYIRSAKGPTDQVLLVPAGSFTYLYGDDTIDVRKPFHNHAVEMALTCLRNGAPAFIKRVALGGDKASICLVVLMTKGMYEYDRTTATEIVKIDQAGNLMKTQAADGAGWVLKYIWVKKSDVAGRIATHKAADTDNEAFLLFTNEASSYGTHGNNIAIKLFSDEQSMDMDVVNDQAALIYTAQIFQRQRGGSYSVVNNLSLGSDLSFCVKPKAYSYKTDVDLAYSHLVNNWTDTTLTSYAVPVYGPLGTATINETGMNDFLTLLKTAETTSGTIKTKDSLYKINFMSGKTLGDIHYYGFQIDSTSAKLISSRTIALIGGTDGDLTDAAFENAVANELDLQYENPSYPLLDQAKYPFTSLWDSGFSVPIKEKFVPWINRRQDIAIYLSTHVVGDATLTAEEEITAGIWLRNAASVNQESVLFGTPACRAVLSMQSCTLLNNRYKERVPTLFDIMAMKAKYGGAATGALKSGFSYDEYPNNRASTITDISNIYLSQYAKDKVWANGLNFYINEDMESQQIPAIQTLYPVKDSVLTSELIMSICTWLEKIQESAWHQLVGNASMPDTLFIDTSNKLLAKLTAGKYDDKVVLVFNTQITPEDAIRGFTWTSEIQVYAANMKTKMLASIVARRLADLTNTGAI